MKITVKVEQAMRFEELTSKAKEKAVSEVAESPWSWETFVDVNDEECGYLDIVEDAGFEDVKIAWSGFSSQGDGASFTANRINFDKIEKAPGFDKMLASVKHGKMLWRVFGNDFSGKVKRTNHHYYHKHTCTAYVEAPYRGVVERLKHPHIQDALEALESTVNKFVDELRCEISGKIYEKLEKDHDAFYSEEHLKELCNINDIFFDESGRMVDDCVDIFDVDYTSVDSVKEVIRTTLMNGRV